MSATLDSLYDAVQLIVDEDVRTQARFLVIAIHDCSHMHQDWINQSTAVRVAAGGLSKALYDYRLKQNEKMFEHDNGDHADDLLDNEQDQGQK